MSNRNDTDVFGEPITKPARKHPPLPSWLERRLLRPGEKVAGVYGPRFNPFWERYITHIGLFLGALGLGVVLVLVDRVVAGSWGEMAVWPALVAGGLVFGSIVILGIANGYFTRLVATNTRLVIMQGYEVCRTWRMDDLPRRLIRYRVGDGPDRGASIDLDAMKTMLGTASDQFVDAKAILAFGKSLGQIKRREDDGG
jgi:hypothetical protein